MSKTTIYLCEDAVTQSVHLCDVTIVMQFLSVVLLWSRRNR